MVVRISYQILPVKKQSWIFLFELQSIKLKINLKGKLQEMYNLPLFNTIEEVRGFLLANTTQHPKFTACVIAPMVSELAEQSTRVKATWKFKERTVKIWIL